MVYWINCSESSIRRRFAWGCTGGAITGAQNFLKDTLTVAKSMEQQQKWPLLVYVFGFFAASTAFVGLLILTACMKRYDATYSAASFVGSFVVSASIMAAVHYNTFEELDGVINSVLYPSGLLLLMGGVYMLVKESCESGGDEDDNSMGQHRQLDATDAETDCDTEDAFRFFEVDGEATREETVV